MRIVEIVECGAKVSDRVRLDFDEREKRRALFRTEAGREILLDRPQARRLRNGQGFRLEDGSTVAIEAKPEWLVAIDCRDSATLIRIAWHLGNRHLLTEIRSGEQGGELRIRPDHVVEAMVSALGGLCRPLEAIFDPEGGAYDQPGPSGNRHQHHHGHE